MTRRPRDTIATFTWSRTHRSSSRGPPWKPAGHPPRRTGFTSAASGTDPYTLRWSRHFEFVVSPDGRRIAGRSLSTTSAEAFHAYLLGHVLSYRSSQARNRSAPRYGRCRRRPGIAFLGDCGYGKSSIAASFVEAGHRLLTDDLLVLKSSVDGLAAFPGPPRIKLSPKMARAFFETQSCGVPMNKFTPKLVVPLRADQIQQTPGASDGDLSAHASCKTRANGARHHPPRLPAQELR